MKIEFRNDDGKKLIQIRSVFTDPDKPEIYNEFTSKINNFVKDCLFVSPLRIDYYSIYNCMDDSIKNQNEIKAIDIACIFKISDFEFYKKYYNKIWNDLVTDILDLCREFSDEPSRDSSSFDMLWGKTYFDL